MKKPYLKSETLLMGSIFQIQLEDKDLKDSLEGVPLKTFLLAELGYFHYSKQVDAERVKRIILLRYGFEDGLTRTLAEVGAEFGLTGARIREIEWKALRRFRRPEVLRKLERFINGEAGRYPLYINNMRRSPFPA